MAPTTSLREIVATFDKAAGSALTADGWRRHRSGVFTLEIGHGSLAWLGLNRATKRWPMEVHPIAGVRHERTMDLVEQFSPERPHRLRRWAPTLSEPVAYLGSVIAPDLRIEHPDDVPGEVSRLMDLVRELALPFALSLADPERQLVALEARLHLPVKEYAIRRRPAMLLALQRPHEAVAALDEELATLEGRDDPAAVADRAFGEAMRNHVHCA